MAEMKKEVVFNIEDDLDENNTWKSCCFKLDKRAVQFFSQLIVISGVMIFSGCQLVRLESCNDQQAYLGLLSTMIGILIPHPTA
jgi:hypothetical protein